MKDIMASLPEVINEYKGYNLLIPTATDVQLNPFYKFHVEEVAVDLSETSGDIFKVGSIDTGRKDDRGNKIYADAFSLSKPLLNKLAMAAGIQFNPEQTYGERIDRVTYRAHAQIRKRSALKMKRKSTESNSLIRLPGALRTISRQKPLRKFSREHGSKQRTNGARQLTPM